MTWTVEEVEEEVRVNPGRNAFSIETSQDRVDRSCARKSHFTLTRDRSSIGKVISFHRR